MAALQFDGTDDRLEWGTLVAALQNVANGAWTMAAVCKRSGSTTDAVSYLKVGTSPGTTKAGMSFNGTDACSVDVGASSAATPGTWGTDVWIVAMSKGAGTVAPRIAAKNLTTAAAWSHTNLDNTIADQVAADALEIGSWQDGDPYAGHIGLVAFWEGAMSDGNKEALATNKQTSDWWGSAHGQPAFLAELNVAAGSVVDLAGNASNPSHTGTTLDGAETLTGWTFDGTGSVPSQLVRPDADVTTTGWTTTPLFSKINDESDATVITATAS